MASKADPTYTDADHPLAIECDTCRLRFVHAARDARYLPKQPKIHEDTTHREYDYRVIIPGLQGAVRHFNDGGQGAIPVGRYVVSLSYPAPEPHPTSPAETEADAAPPGANVSRIPFTDAAW